MTRPKIYLFGDSITEISFIDGGWGASLAHHFSRTADIVVRGYSGYNTRWALKVLDKVFPARNDDDAPPVAVTVFFGANDACLHDGYGSFQHVPLEEYKKNLHSLYSFFKGVCLKVLEPMRGDGTGASISSYIYLEQDGPCIRGLLFLKCFEKRWPSTTVIFITPPPIDEAARLLNAYADNPSGRPERTNDVARAYAEACIDVAKECGTAVVDIWTKMQELPDWRNSCLSDGLHLAQSGNRIVFEEVVAKLKEAGLCLEKLPADLPLFSDIDPNDPLKTFGN